MKNPVVPVYPLPLRRLALVIVMVVGGLVAAASEHSPSYLTIPRLVDEKRIINAHEHVQGVENTDVLLREMDAQGFGKTVLLGSPWFTISLYERAGFTRYDENNAAIVEMAQKHPDRFLAWPTVNPLDPDKVSKIKALVEQGATGVKLYLGHGYTSRRNEYIFHPIAMDDPGMFGLYAFLAANHIPVCLHVNPAKPGFMDEFIQVLKQYPDLKVNSPHYMLSSMSHSRLREMFRTFPNFYVDISFGHDDYLRTGLERVSENRRAFRTLFVEFPERFIFGTDYVITSLRPHDSTWYQLRTDTYLDMLSKDTFSTELMPGRTLNGLALPGNVLERILYKNFEDFMASKPTGTVISRELDWRELRIRPVARTPGEPLPPPARWRRR